MQVRVLWGCDPARQLELHWIRWLVGSSCGEECAWWLPEHRLSPAQPGTATLLIESGLLRLERSPAPERLRQLQLERTARIEQLVSSGRFAVLHLSDEEGFDADTWYPSLPRCTPIWRNFVHPRFEVNPQVRTFPIGPRDLFLVPPHQPFAPASQRDSPWAFMGTLWPSGSRREAVSLFLSYLPTGHYFGGQRFGQGLELQHYRANLCASVFALAPEGDRHLDTFRLWESLCCGCIPLLVDHRTTADRLLMAPHPLPVLSCWREALAFAQAQLADPKALDALQARISCWWQQRQRQLSQALLASLRPVCG